MQLDTAAVKKWFLREKRDLPWRENPSPYAVWVSEVMLQQTQVSVVIPYFERWMQLFPTVEELAKASIESVIKAWEGLGYYSRARNLQSGARTILEKYQGQLPDTEEALSEIKGLGHYTIGAIRSFAFHQRAAAVDGNVMRVLTRYFGIQDDIAKPKTIRTLREIALEILPEDESWIVNEALIELGATVCTKKAKCSICPLKNSCLAFQKGLETKLPVKSKPSKTEALFRAVAIVNCDDHILVKKGKAGEIMQDLYEFPYFETGKEGAELAHYQQQWASLKMNFLHELETISHSFTRFRVKLFPKAFVCSKKLVVEGCQWVSFAELESLPFSSGHRRILQLLSKTRSTPLNDKPPDRL